MPLHPQAQALRDRWAAAQTPPLYTLTVAQARAADIAAIRSTRGTRESVHSVTNAIIPGPGGQLAVRVYKPAAAPGPLPVLVYFFGGGWTLGSLETCDALCRTLTNAVGCVTVAIGYRLAPEHKFPAAVLDCAAGVRWVAANAAALGVDPNRLAVAGDSAGGNLAAATCLHARDTGGPAIATQVLVYPNTHYGRATGSAVEAIDPVFFNRNSVRWYWNHYLADPAAGRNPLASPLLAADHSGLPPALIITAEYDPLRDEGAEYADQLAAAGGQVCHRRYDGVMHGFFTMSGELDAARTAVAQVAGHLRGVFAQIGAAA
ncbi:alpha/beta hydrolase [Nocardia huaxiensis]|uniref:alpha/beta hydrolase n=1 Tax=Nocardia huaxiensis TaxID=2755382 RepID=UPI001E56F434|nr:alpha/beta hydrolase [Nocardia huaxiensis]UFS96838.1 alpha/beta hydrolase [Nocardia huaxiensis]